MQMNYYTFIDIIKWFLHKSNMNENDKMFIHYNMKDLLSSYWNGVGEWKIKWFVNIINIILIKSDV